MHCRGSAKSKQFKYPIGYVVERTWLSPVDRHSQCTYRCETEKDEVENRQFFLVTEISDRPGRIAIRSRGIKGIAGQLRNAINNERKARGIPLVDLPSDVFGFSNPAVLILIASLDEPKRVVPPVLGVHNAPASDFDSVEVAVDFAGELTSDIPF